ncbi:MAG: hypothetical protein V4505_22355 [Pseudomonadota bacterium]
MIPLHTLTRQHPDGRTELLAWHADRAVLEAEALRLEWLAYDQAMALSSCGSLPASPDHTTHRAFVVVMVPHFDADT